jgi:EAL domain-containing protein (putative c-di-GMP-specific phosphodiesterase class I)
MSTSCAQLHEWQAQGVLLPQLAINLSGSALLGEHVVELLRRQLQQYDLTGERVELEITESSLIADPKRASALIQRLQAMGCRVAIDDFGTGYSSLSYLKHFRADVLKIDRSFVTGVDRDQSNQSIARAVIAVGHALQMKVLAEGVERVEELHWLRAAGCDLIQGYYLSRPLAAAQLAQFVADWQPEQWRLQALALTAKAASGG